MSRIFFALFLFRYIKNLYIFVCKIKYKFMSEPRKKNVPVEDLQAVLLNNLTPEEIAAVGVLKLLYNEKTASRAIKRSLNAIFIQSLKA